MSKQDPAPLYEPEKQIPKCAKNAMLVKAAKTQNE